MKTPIALALAGLAALAGCSEQDRRTVVLSAAVQSCTAWAETQLQEGAGIMVPAGIDTQRMCTCVVQRTAEGKSLTELVDFFSGNPLPDARTVSACAIEEGRRSGVLIRETER